MQGDKRSASRIALFGTGLMGEGIARLCVEHGFPLVLLSGSPDRAEGLGKKLVEEAPDAEISTDGSEIGVCGVFIEATVEVLGAKQEILARAEEELPADALMATTTSSLSITELGSILRSPERFLGLHFFNPVARMRLVEVVAGMRTSADVVDEGRAFAESIGKHPIRVPDQAGFLVNRLLIPYLNQAARLAESGFATVEDIDTAMKLGAGHPMGPFALIDLIGADVCLAISASLSQEFHATSDSPSAELRRRAALGWLGRKTGRGYYDYTDRD
jgi:3-hydroxybutyryl-CoA dehydrogenase